LERWEARGVMGITTVASGQPEASKRQGRCPASG
jgi:hypothetical protein